jgi:hypothetical protein
LVFGVFLPIAPWSVVSALLIIPLAFAAPVGALGVLVAITVLVPFELQDALSVFGGREQPGLLVVDALMLLGLTRIVWLFVRGRLRADLPLLLGIVAAACCAAALLWGVANGGDVSVAGNEARRVMLGVVAFVLAWPLMENRSARRRLLQMLIGIGLLLGLWGLAQWVFSVGYSTAGDVGVRESELVSRQLQGGMYAYPVAVVMAWAALIAGQLRSTALKCVLAIILCLNSICLLLTFERTLWAATGVACVYVVVTSGTRTVGTAVKWAGAGVVVLVAAAAVASAGASTAVERMSSVGRLKTDNSLKWRVVESQIVAQKISGEPVTGSGFGSTITWGVRDTFATMTTPFIHDGYIWLAWKIGVPAALLIVLFLSRAVWRRLPTDDGAEWRMARIGSKASLLALLLISITFPAFNDLGITAVMGVLAALCYSACHCSSIPTLSRPPRERSL